VLRGPGREDGGLFAPPEGETTADPVPTIGVLARADELGGSSMDPLERWREVAAEYGDDEAIGPHCQTVLPVAGLLALGGVSLGEPEYRALAELSEQAPAELAERATPELLALLGRFGVDLALRLIRGGEAPTHAALSDELVRRSGLPRLRELLVWRFARPIEALRVRAALAELEALARTETQRGPRTDELLYQLERIRSGRTNWSRSTSLWRCGPAPCDCPRPTGRRPSSCSAPPARNPPPGWGWPWTPAGRRSTKRPASG